jgi:hypothetical protein
MVRVSDFSTVVVLVPTHMSNLEVHALLLAIQILPLLYS